MLEKEFNKVPKIYRCEKCNYFSVRESQWKRHINTKKHIASIASKNASKKVRYACLCGKTYSHDSSFYRHRKMCNYKEDLDAEQDKSMAELLCEVVTQNKMLQEQIITMQNEHQQVIKTQTKVLQELMPKIGTTINTNSHNKIINVQMFLSEKCADAMSIQHFAKQLEVTLDDLCKDKKDCLTNVVLKSLKPLSLTERPFHCANLRTKEWYIKDENYGWEEDNGDKLIKNAEHGIQKKWMYEFEKHYPRWMENDELQSKYVNIAGSTTRELPEKIKLKLLKELAREAQISNEETKQINDNKKN